jgi:hypothetical protein
VRAGGRVKKHNGGRGKGRLTRQKAGPVAARRGLSRGKRRLRRDRNKELCRRQRQVQPSFFPIFPIFFTLQPPHFSAFSPRRWLFVEDVM